jgi:hypothetical protein
VPGKKIQRDDRHRKPDRDRAITALRFDAIAHQRSVHRIAAARQLSDTFDITM